MFELFIICGLLYALRGANKRLEEAGIGTKKTTIKKPVEIEYEDTNEYDVNSKDSVVTSIDLDAYMQENNIKAFFCSHENRIYWVQNHDELLFCPHDSTLLYAC